MISFIEKTWFLWWMLAILVAVAWFHALSAATKLQDPDSLALSSEEDEEAQVSTVLLREAKLFFLPATQRTF